MSDSDRRRAVEEGLKADILRMRAVLEAYERWEADLVMDNEAWDGGLAELPTLNYPLWDRLLEIQTMRNRAIGLCTVSRHERGR